MKQEIVDLHTHTFFSDGTLSPGQLLERAANNGVAVMSITDHDTVRAYEDTSIFDKAQSLGVTLIPGIEVSTDHEGHGVHILGLFIETQNVAIQSLIKQQNTYRHTYASLVIGALEKDGWAVDPNLLTRGTSSVTKAHIARGVVGDTSNRGRLVDIFGRIPTAGAFIEAMMNDGGKYHVVRQSLSPKEVIDSIHSAKGIAVLAHPVASLYEGMDSRTLDEVIASYDLDALEAFYYYHDQSVRGATITAIDQMTQLAKSSNLAVTPGSDYHGPNPFHGPQVDVGFKGFSSKPRLKYYKKLLKLRNRLYL